MNARSPGNESNNSFHPTAVGFTPTITITMKPERLATVISILGVVLTAASVVASIAQYRAADLQAKAAVIALMPQIEVRALPEKIDSDKYTDSRVEVTSDGGPIYNFNMSRRSWIEFKVGKTVAYRQPLVGYYFAEYRTGHTKGPITTLKGVRNNEAFFDFLRWAEPTLGSDTEILQPVTLLRMTYNDALKQENLNYVLLSGGSVTHLSEDDGTKLWDRQSEEERTNLPIDISQLKTGSIAAEKLAIWKSEIAEARK